MLTRNEKEESAAKAAVEYGISASPTGMYRVSDSEEIEPPQNVCGVCLFCEDDPNNFGDTIVPTAYDGDCDECNIAPFEDVTPNEMFSAEAFDLMVTPSDQDE